jgi:glucokinase
MSAAAASDPPVRPDARRAPIGSGVTPVLEIGGSHVTAALVVCRDTEAGAGTSGAGTGGAGTEGAGTEGAGTRGAGTDGAATVLPASVRRDPLRADAGADELLAAIVGCASSLPVAAGARWGVAVPGPFDYRRGVALFRDVGKFESLYGVDVGAALAAALPAPPASIGFVNDADAFLLGEWHYGAADGRDRCVGITLGTGVGSAFIVDGEPRDAGTGVPPQGRVDLLRIDGRPLEDVVSTRAIRAAYTDPTLTVADIAALARGGEPTAAMLLDHAFERLGAALAPYLAAFGAQVLVVGGAMTGSWDLIEPSLRLGLRAAEPRLAGLAVTVAQQPERAALLGAAVAAGRWPVSYNP